MDREFDPTISYVTAAGGLFAGHTLTARYPVTIVDEPARPAELTTEQAQHLVKAGKLIPASSARPTPVERPEDAVERLADLEPMEGDKFLIRAPWLPDGSETVTGEEQARARLAEVKQLGLDHYHAAEKAAAKTVDAQTAADVAGASITGGDGFGLSETGSNGYFTVSAPGKEPEKVRGREAAERRLAELRAEAAAATGNDGEADETRDED